MSSTAATRARRLSAVQSALAAANLTGLLVTAPADLRWLTGFTGSSGAALVLPDDQPLLATDGRYLERAAVTAPEYELVDSREPMLALAAAAQSRGALRVGIAAGDVSLRSAAQLRATSTAEFIDDVDLIPCLRVTKDAGEIESIRRACAITDQAVTEIHAALAVGMTERDVARRFVDLVLDAGAEGVAFPPIVAFGPSSAIPHHEPGSRELVRGDLVLLDVGARVDGYCADMTRTISVGEPDPQLRELHAVVVEAQAAGRNAARAGQTVIAVDSAVRAVLADAGVADLFVHGTGHGVGLEIHEAPLIAEGSDAILGTSSTVTVEPGVYLPGRGGIRVEDLILIGEGDNESLTQLPRDLVVL